MFPFVFKKEKSIAKQGYYKANTCKPKFFRIAQRVALNLRFAMDFLRVLISVNEVEKYHFCFHFIFSRWTLDIPYAQFSILDFRCCAGKLQFMQRIVQGCKRKLESFTCMGCFIISLIFLTFYAILYILCSAMNMF